METQLRRSSLGRVAFIGELYNAKTETFASRSLLKSNFPPDLIECKDIGQTEFDYRFTSSASERFNLLEIEAELAVSVLIGLVSVKGCGTFLTEEEESENSACCSLICKISTVCEKFFASFAEIMHHIDLTALEDSENTHVVTEVNWGANCLLSLVASGESRSDIDGLKGQLLGKLEKLKVLLSMSGAGALEKKDSTLKTSDNVRIKVRADIVPEGSWPTSVESFCQFVTEVPKLLKAVNKGKGKPINYGMISLNTFRRLAKLSAATDIFVKSIDESFLSSTKYLLEDIALLKRKFHDLLTQMTSSIKYVREDDLKAARKYQQDLIVKESELKLLISEHWVNVRSGKKSLTELIRQVEGFKNRSLRLYAYEEYLESTTEILEKLAMIRYFTSLGIVYLGLGDTFESVLARNLSCEFLVLLVSSEIKKQELELYIHTSHYFLTEANDPRQETKYVVVDFDYRQDQTFMNVSVTSSRIFHLKGSKILSKNKYADYVADLSSNFVRPKKGAEVVHMRQKPGNRVPLEMICPGFQDGICSTDLLLWTCFRCKSSVEYGFNNFFYCSCGRVLVTDTEYRCSHPTHGSFFITGRSDFIQSNLSSLKPLKEMNVLILGCSGVGKSTWINSIINYLSFETLDQAKEHGVICTIPARFIMYDAESSKKYVIEIGEENDEEKTKTGQSATQFSHTYSFIWENKYVRLIDTPGLGDTRGIEQDKMNLQNIIQHIDHLKDLHGVCILLKANDNRINAIFSYCLKELLVHLHRSITKNIVFCFTNARNSLYTPGQTSAVLELLIRQLGAEKDLPLGRHNMFCLDNEAFIFLCSLMNTEITYSPKLIESFGHSWKISLDETKRLFETIRSFEPHTIKETVSLMTVRRRILSLTKSVARISQVIQINVDNIGRYKQQIKVTKESLDDWSKKLKSMETHLEPIYLDFPRTVCTSPSCVEYLKFKSSDMQEIEYKTHCHIKCCLKNVQQMTVNNAALRNCDIMGKDGKCNNCGCGWEKHMHITYVQKRVEKESVNKSVEEIILRESTYKEKKECLVKELENLIEKYEKEQEFIIQASVKFGMFLQRNAITVYNDSVAEYMQYLIDQEESKPNKSNVEKNLLHKMKETLAQYNVEIAILMECVKKGENNKEELSIQKILELEQQLYRLELTGKDIERNVACDLHSMENMKRYTETVLQILHAPTKGPKQHSVPLDKETEEINVTSKNRFLKWIGK